MIVEFISSGNQWDVMYRNRICGYILKSEKYYYVMTTLEKHFFKKYQGFGLSRRIAVALRKRGVIWVNIIYHGQDKHRYSVKLERFIRRGIRYADNSGETPDLQYILPVKWMKEEKV